MGRREGAEMSAKSVYAFARTVPCPSCLAKPGQPCTRNVYGERASRPHQCRLDEAARREKEDRK